MRSSGVVAENEYDYTDDYADYYEEALDKEKEEYDYDEYPDDLCPDDNQVCSELDQCGEEGINPYWKTSPLENFKMSHF